MFHFVDRWIERWEGNALPAVPPADEAAMVLANLEALLPREGGAKQVLLLNETSTPDLAPLRKRLTSDHIQFDIGRNLAGSADTVQRLAACDGVVLVIETRHTTRTSLVRDIELIRQIGKEIYGYLVWQPQAGGKADA